MAEYGKFVLFGTVYASSDAADMDYEAVKSLYYDWRLIDNFDAAIITKRDDGKVKILRKHEQPTRKGGWRGAGWGLATGAVIALFPAAAIGGGLLAATSGTGLIVVAAADVGSKVEQALSNASEVTKKELEASDEEIDKDVAEPESETSS